MKQLKETRTPVFLLLNKIDMIKKEELLEVISSYNQYMKFKNTIPISAISGDGVDLLLEEIIKILPEGPKYFPDDIVPST